MEKVTTKEESTTRASKRRTQDVENMENWSFQYNEKTDDYSLFFGISDSKGRSVAVSATVYIRFPAQTRKLIGRCDSFL